MTDTPKAADLPYRPCVGVVLFNSAGEVFIGRRAGLAPDIGEAGCWQFPQGGIDEGESPEQAALRELAEETGVTQAEILAEYPGWLTYDLPEHLVGKAWGGKYRGQRMKWFAMLHEGPDTAINLQVAGHRPEFDVWRWEELQKVPALAVPFKREMYERLVKAFSPLVEKLRQTG